MAFELPNLPYAHDALEPHIDARTMEIHHGKHHAGYTNNLNNAVTGTDMEGKDIESLLRDHSDNGAVAQQRWRVLEPLLVLDEHVSQRWRNAFWGAR